MKRKILITILCSAVICAVGALAACSKPHEHTWNNGEITTPATCAAVGIKTYTCTDCGETKTETVAKTEHAHSAEWLKNDDEHWHAATCEHSGERVGVSRHVWDEGQTVTKATCINTGLIKYSCECGLTETEIVEKTNHSYAKVWSSDDDKHWHACTTVGCGETTDEGTHNWNSGEITTPPTCLAEGVKTYTCTDCKRKKTEPVEKTDHDYDTEWSADENGHFHACKTIGCTAKKDEHTHSLGEWEVKSQMVKICADCGYEKNAPYLTSSDPVNISLGGGETAGITMFTRGTGYYTITCNVAADTVFTCRYYDRIGTYYEKEFTLTATNNTFTIKLQERSVCNITAISQAEEASGHNVSVSFSESAPGHIHTFEEEWSTDGSFHWHACTGADCEEDRDAGVHEYENGVCKECGYIQREEETTNI